MKQKVKVLLVVALPMLILGGQILPQGFLPGTG